MRSKVTMFISVVCLALFFFCFGGGSDTKTIKNDKLYPFLLSGIYDVYGYGGQDKFFKMFSEGMNAKPGGRTFLTELNEAYEELFIFPYEDDRSGTRRELSNSWGIESKEDFLETADFLLTEGHQQAYEFCRKVLDENGGEQADINNIDLKKYASEYDGRLGKIKNIKFVKENYNNFSPAGIKAWDIARYVNNVNIAYCAEYITEEEAHQLVAKALIEAQKYYQDWNEYWSDFNLGRYFWGGDDDPAFTKIANALTDKENAYSIYHYMPLK
ncbi:MAG: DUF1266 domain-containing protein [Bacteroidales bacterium]|jgi:hypothetical protein|nr:DUF1266 domain-containing protein [Bacteroidales bacterium]